MNCYNLVSCNNSLYPDILDLCHRGTHPQQGRVVYINEGAVDPSKTYTLTFVGANACVCSAYIPKLITTTQDSCTPSYGIFKYVNCETGVSINFGFPSGDPVNVALRKNGDCDCWQFAGEEATANELISAYTEYSSCNECLETREAEICPTADRTIGYAVRVNLPDSPKPDRDFSKCCYLNLALADVSDADEYKNDFSGCYFKRETPSSTVVFKLVNTATLAEYFLNSDTYGTFQAFGGVQADLSYYIVEWRKVLTLLGAGTYQIKKEVDIAGISVDIFSNTYTLKPFSIDTADKTIRLDSYMDGKLIDIETDFKGTGYKTSVRLRGFFGRNERSFEQDNIAQRDYNLVQNTMSSKSTYQFQGLQIPECITEEIWNFMIFGNELVISDYNKNNHSYKYELIPVVLEDNSGTEFFVLDRPVNINLQFTDRRQNSRKINC